MVLQNLQLAEVLLAISGDLEFNYSNDSWQIEVNSSPSHWHMCSWDFYTLKVIHRVPRKQSGFCDFQPDLFSMTYCPVRSLGIWAGLWRYILPRADSLTLGVSILTSCQASRDTQSAFTLSWEQESAGANRAYFHTSPGNIDYRCGRICLI